MPDPAGRIAIVGGGWAGMAAAVTLASAGRPVTGLRCAEPEPGDEEA